MWASVENDWLLRGDSREALEREEDENNDRDHKCERSDYRKGNQAKAEPIR